MSSPPASPGSFPSVAGSTRDGWVGGTGAEGSSRAGAALASAAPPPSVARSDVSRLSADSHHSLHSIYSQRSRWSTAATLGGTSTVQRLAQEQPLEPAEPLPEEMSGASSTVSGEGEAGELQQAAARGRWAASGAAGALAASSTRGSRGGGTSAATSRAVALQEAAGAPGNPTALTGVAGERSTEDGRLPPRLIIFHPDGQTFGIGVDKLREHELQRAAEAAATERRRQQREAAAAEGSGAAGDGAAASPGSREEGFDENYPGWRQLYARQKYILAGVLLLDVAYLVVLLVLRLVWGNSSTDPSPSGAAEFFIGSHPESTSVSYLAGSLFTDVVALYGAIQNYASIVTLFIVWSVVLGAFAILEMPLLFIIIRLILLVAAFQFRFSMARLRNMLPPTSLGMYLSAAGRGMAASGGAAWAGATRPFRRRGQPAPAGAATPAAARVGRRSRTNAATGMPASPSAHVSPVAAARSSALFRAAVVRMMSEQRQAEFERDLELGAPERQPQALPHSVAVDASGARPSSSLVTGSSGSPARPSDRRSRGAAADASAAVAAQAAAPAAEPGPGPRQDPAASDSLGRLYSRIMEDIAAVAAAPSSASERRRQRRRERQRSSRQLAAAMSAGPTSSGGGRQGPSPPPVRGDGSSGDDGSDGERPAAGEVPSRSRRPRSSSSRLQRSEAAIAAAAASGTQPRASASTSAEPAAGAVPSGPPSWAELMALLNFHSEQQQARRQRNVDVVPLVSLTAPPPAAEEGQDDPGSSAGGTPSQPGRHTGRQGA